MDGPARWRVTGPSGTYRAAADQGEGGEASGQGGEASSQSADPPREGAGRGGTPCRWQGDRGEGVRGGGAPGSAVLHRVSRVSSWAVPSPPPARGVKKPLTPGGAKAVRKAEAEPAQEAEPDGDKVPSSEPPRVPSREIRNIIRMYQSRPGPVPVPVQPSRWVRGRPARPTPHGGTCGLLTFSFSQEAPPKFPEEKQP